LEYGGLTLLNEEDKNSLLTIAVLVLLIATVYGWIALKQILKYDLPEILNRELIK